MEAIVDILKKYGWRAEEPLVSKEGSVTKPVYSDGHRRAVVGPLWTTLYTKEGAGIAEMRSIRTDNAKRIERAVAPGK